MRHPIISSGAIGKSWRLLFVRAAALLVVMVMCSGGLSAYSVLTHEQIVDLAWSDQIQPLLLKRYPGLSVRVLHDATIDVNGTPSVSH